MLAVSLHLPVQILPQPTETTCGPTCLHSLYRYWGMEEPLQNVIGRTRIIERGGTLAVFLACDALARGFKATIYTYNLMVFDPVWFSEKMDIAERLRLQLEAKADPRLQSATEGYLEFLQLGGKLQFTDLSLALVRSLLGRGLPILTGLSSTFLYRTPREYGPHDIPDDIRGTPSGHFVILAGYDLKNQKVLVADPYGPHPYGNSREYWIRLDRVLNSVLLGIVTHDANLLVIYPTKKMRRPRHEYFDRNR
ncbi:N utilization substance protein B homolog [Novimethylophilus kurashikiensis]|uniref:N utilization substance protein B homolog n=1 Tax=Novimethylophilus kurashikiensis TaxID=1825523 RepID=A0A2R5FA23_9PROT|nr:C39 family peptidase [Novimethylophilus kurashikiensis]GBG15082.1 N utilization substance protein B homolog [Novimethylophilus kurashikiensis]